MTQTKKNEIKLLITDFDGVMTDGKRYFSENGQHMKAYNMKDGLAISNFKANGIKTMILSGDNSVVTQIIVNRLKFNYIKIGIENKETELNQFIINNNLTWNDVLYIGDDLNDYECLNKAKYKYVPQDCNKQLLSIKNIKQLESKGGDGCLSELFNLII